MTFFLEKKRSTVVILASLCVRCLLNGSIPPHFVRSSEFQLISKTYTRSSSPSHECVQYIRASYIWKTVVGIILKFLRPLGVRLIRPDLGAVYSFGTVGKKNVCVGSGREG